MKYIISESKLESFIEDYLNNSYHPDYGWGPELWEFYKGESEHYGYVDLTIDDVSAYQYLYKENEWEKNLPKTLLIQPWVAEKLDDLFGNIWEPLFVNWFEKNSGLPVEHFVIK